MLMLKSALSIVLLVFSLQVHASLITCKFTNAGQVGRLVPSQSQIDIAYGGGNLDSSVTSMQGVQLWTVQHTGKYTITAYGAKGGDGLVSFSDVILKGGNGASVSGVFTLNAGDKLKILIGQMGSTEGSYVHRPGGGGGGTFLTLFDNTPLLVAGGGGG